MEYKQFMIDAFQREPGKWRARVRRTSGRLLRADRVTRSRKFITETDSPSASEALMMAMAAIDAGKFSRHDQK